MSGVAVQADSTFLFGDEHDGQFPSTSPANHPPVSAHPLGPRGEHAADTLAAFLRALHVAAPADAPVDTGRGVHPKDCTAGFDRFFDSVDADAIGSDAADVRAVWDDAVSAPAWEGPPVTVGALQTGAFGIAAPILVSDRATASVGVVQLGVEVDDALVPAVMNAAAEAAARLSVTGRPEAAEG